MYSLRRSLEGGTEDEFGIVDHPEWVEDDNVLGSPICGAVCPSDSGTAGSRTGSNWAWFGGIEESEQEQSISQVRTLAAEPVTATLSFYVFTDSGVESPICQVAFCGTGSPSDIREPHGGDR